MLWHKRGDVRRSFRIRYRRLLDWVFVVPAELPDDTGFAIFSSFRVCERFEVGEDGEGEDC